MREVLRSPRWLLTIALAGAAGCFSDGGPVIGGSTGEPTTDTGDDSAPTTDTGDVGLPQVCGDGMAMAPEECDDGDDDSSDACTVACKLPACGDGYVQAGEACDAGPDNADDAVCTSTCAMARCGDGLTLPGVEACDDGNLDAGDGCSPVCTLETCGNAVADPGEKCDDGNPSDTDDCKADCTPAVCGDGIAAVDASVPELCDDGNTDEADGCNSKCTASGCGDGFLQPGEACDDGNLVDGDTCGPLCERLAFAVFVTSEGYTGDLGGIAGADLKCNQRAQVAGLPGNFMAWISDDVQAASGRLFHAQDPYTLVGGGVIADHWLDLSNGTLMLPIDHDEFGQPVVVPIGDCEVLGAVWTGTEPNGAIDPDNCDGWSTDGNEALVGMLFRQGSDWTASCDLPCDMTARLYCVEQPPAMP